MKILWVGDAVVASGFAKSTHKIVDVLSEDHDIHIIGINYRGDPHDYVSRKDGKPIPIYPAWITGSQFGVDRVPEKCLDLEPDLVIIQQDPWNFPVYLEAMKEAGCEHIPVIGIVAVDGKNCKGYMLNGLQLAIFWTEFGMNEARAGGYNGPAAVVPLGVDLDIYKPMDKMRLRANLEHTPSSKVYGLTPESFIVLNVNRNQVRKRLDLTIEYFAQWVHSKDVKDAFLFMHSCPTGEQEFDLEQLARYYKVRDRLTLITPEIGKGVPEIYLAATYNMADVLVNTGQGEGFGLPAFEAMACGTPNISGNWAAHGELLRDVALLVECDTFATTQKRINVIGGIPNREQFVGALDLLYNNRAVLRELSERGFAYVSQEKFRWEHIGEEIRKVIEASFHLKDVNAII